MVNHLNEEACPWTNKETIAQRLNSCASMLVIWGLISESERKKIHHKLMKKLGRSKNVKRNMAKN